MVETRNPALNLPFLQHLQAETRTTTGIPNRNQTMLAKQANPIKGASGAYGERLSGIQWNIRE